MIPTDTHANVIVLCERLIAATVALVVEWRAGAEDEFSWDRDEGSVTRDP